LLIQALEGVNLTVFTASDGNKELVKEYFDDFSHHYSQKVVKIKETINAKKSPRLLPKSDIFRARNQNLIPN
jgi:hypothetical protein